jgi:hypothetical protein
LVCAALYKLIYNYHKNIKKECTSSENVSMETSCYRKLNRQAAT